MSSRRVLWLKRVRAWYQQFRAAWKAKMNPSRYRVMLCTGLLMLLFVYLPAALGLETADKVSSVFGGFAGMVGLVLAFTGAWNGQLEQLSARREVGAPTGPDAPALGAGAQGGAVGAGARKDAIESGQGPRGPLELGPGTGPG